LIEVNADVDGSGGSTPVRFSGFEQEARWHYI
jgi:hypothetical protein